MSDYRQILTARGGPQRRILLLLAAAAAAAASVQAHAAEPVLPAEATAPVTATPRATPSQNVTINLINRLVERGVLPKEDAADLIKMAEADAAEARAQAVATQSAAAQAVASAQAAQSSLQTLALAPDLATAPHPPEPDESTVRVTYIPEVVKAQMRDEIRADVMAQARNEHWAAPNIVPEWVTRFKISGDIRVRAEGNYFPDGNDNTGAFPNFNAINTGAPYDVSGTLFSPQLNVDQDRNRIRLRARVGAEVDLAEGFTAGLRIATGENNSPVTTNQSLGLANQGQGGNFSKYAIWLDRAFLKYELGGLPNKNLAITVGRFDNPFFTTEIIWDDDIGFDGAVLQAKYEVGKGVTPFLTAGAFPVFNTDFNFASNQPSKFKSEDKWLYGGQIGADWKINKEWNFKIGAAFYDFENIEGKLSDPFTPLNAQDAGNTDNSRPSFAQKGNTYRPIRNIVPNASNNFGTTNQFQYFGLATAFREVALTARLNFTHFEPFNALLFGEYVRNVAFDSNDIDLVAVNNRGANQANGALGSFSGGDTAWIIGLKLGHAALEKRWDWNVAFSYRYVESDAVVDGFTDSDFGNGGTNLKGYTLGASVALSKRISLGLRWLSADSIDGPRYRNDTLQFDINGKF
ncbi:MAG: hypothetical protein JWL90_391 [Chthoniobacteraceae bacterium]|nr:hypothetical protein [Chthoniobacteraceae bacterium]